MEKNTDVLGAPITGKLHSLPLSKVIDHFLDSVLIEKNRKSILHLMEMAEYWAVAIRNLIDVLAPKKVIVGGSMLRAKSLILPIIENEIEAHLFPFEESGVGVEVSDLGEYNGAIGAATFLLAEIYDIPEPEYYFDLI